jgi:hypothetical protein
MKKLNFAIFIIIFISSCDKGFVCYNCKKTYTPTGVIIKEQEICCGENDSCAAYWEYDNTRINEIGKCTRK